MSIAEQTIVELMNPFFVFSPIEFPKPIWALFFRFLSHSHNDAYAYADACIFVQFCEVFHVRGMQNRQTMQSRLRLEPYPTKKKKENNKQKFNISAGLW